MRRDSVFIRLMRAVVLQDYFLGFRRTGVIPRYTLFKLLEEFMLISLTTLLLNSYMDTVISIMISILFIHILLALLSPPLLQFTKSLIKPQPRSYAYNILNMILKDICYRCKSIYLTGSIIFNQEKEYLRDMDLACVPRSNKDAVILLLYLQLIMLKYLTRRIKILPDFYITESDLYEESLEVDCRLVN